MKLNVSSAVAIVTSVKKLTSPSVQPMTYVASPNRSSFTNWLGGAGRKSSSTTGSQISPMSNEVAQLVGGLRSVYNRALLTMRDIPYIGSE